MQIIGYKWRKFVQGWEPVLLINDGRIETTKLLSSNINFSVGEKGCIGYSKNGKRFSCGSNPIGMICNTCKTMDDFWFCIECRGERCINLKQRSDCEKKTYFIYIAAFDSLLKVGISQDHRWYERLIEQGADLGAKVGAVKDGLKVRAHETAVSKFLGITDRVTGKMKEERLFGNPNNAAISLLKAIAKLNEAGYEWLVQPEIYDFRSYFHLDLVPERPKALNIEEGTDISGTIVSAKGNILVMHNSDGWFSLDARKLLGRKIYANEDFLQAKDVLQIISERKPHTLV